LDGNTVCEQFGWPAMTKPSSLGNQAVPVSGGGVSQSCWPRGSAAYVTVTENRWFCRIALRGVMISSAPSREKATGPPLNRTLLIVLPSKSRSNPGQRLIRPARTVVTASTVLVSAWYVMPVE
jgi:hypothetical protein